MKVLVTGGAGFIGSHACKALAAAGFTPVAYDNLSQGHSDAVRWGPLEIGSLNDAAKLRIVIARHNPGAVFHVAGVTSVAESVRDPALYRRNNIEASRVLLDALSDARPVPVVFSSSAAVYGMPDHAVISDDHPLRPFNPYGESKLAVETMLNERRASHGLRSFSLRYFNAAGCDPDGELGERHEPETHLIPLVLRAAQTGLPVKIFGDDYSTADGTCVRDYVHVSDIADAQVLALHALLAGSPGGAFNLATERGVSIGEVIDTAERVCGRKIARVTARRRPGDPPTLVGSARQAQTMLGWRPRRSNLGTQIEDVWRWMRAQSAR